MTQFKVGDRVAVYTTTSELMMGVRRTGVVDRIFNSLSPNHVIQVRTDTGTPIFESVHWKQCRKLKRKKRAVIWLNRYPHLDQTVFYGEYVYHSEATAIHNRSDHPPGGETVKFIEAIKPKTEDCPQNE